MDATSGVPSKPLRVRLLLRAVFKMLGGGLVEYGIAGEVVRNIPKI